jgi:serine/threonine-protein kinase
LRRCGPAPRGAALIAATVSALLISAAAVSIRQAQLARQQTQLAQVEARTAQAVQDFLEGIFKASSGDQVDPIAARQRTARQLLDEGAARVDLALRDVPMARLRVLGTLADVYRQMGLLDAAAKLLEARSEGFAALGERQAAAQVIALSQWAEILVQAGSRAKAREVLKRAEWVSRTLPDSAEASKASYQVALAALHADAGDAQGLPAAEAQLAALRLQPPTVDRLRCW